VRVLCRLRKITQGKMAEEIGIPKRTLEEWLQYRRMPMAPGETLMRRRLEAHVAEETSPQIAPLYPQLAG